jgi:hypothetical protein
MLLVAILDFGYRFVPNANEWLQSARLYSAEATKRAQEAQ